MKNESLEKMKVALHTATAAATCFHESCAAASSSLCYSIIISVLQHHHLSRALSPFLHPSLSLSQKLCYTIISSLSLSLSLCRPQTLDPRPYLELPDRAQRLEGDEDLVHHFVGFQSAHEP